MQTSLKMYLLVLFFCSFTLFVFGQKEITEKSMMTGKKVTITTNDKSTKKVNHNLERKKRTKKQYRILYVRAKEAGQEVKTNKKERTYSEDKLITDEKNKRKLDYYYMSGNPCVEQVTHRYGFEYELVPKTVKMNVFRRFFHNLGVNTLTFLKNGPFWKKRMKKKIRICMGDVLTT